MILTSLFLFCILATVRSGCEFAYNCDENDGNMFSVKCEQGGECHFVKGDTITNPGSVPTETSDIYAGLVAGQMDEDKCMEICNSTVSAVDRPCQYYKVCSVQCTVYIASQFVYSSTNQS